MLSDLDSDYYTTSGYASASDEPYKDEYWTSKGTEEERSATPGQSLDRWDGQSVGPSDPAQGRGNWQQQDRRNWGERRGQPPGDVSARLQGRVYEQPGGGSPYRRQQPRDGTPDRRDQRQESPYREDQFAPDYPQELIFQRRTPTPPPLRPTEPTPEYNQTALTQSKPLADPTSSRKLLILDLNGTLVVRGDRRRNQRSTFQQPTPYGQSSAPPPRALRTVYGRPYLSTFREFLLHPETKKWLDTMVWSSAQPHSVDDMVEKAFGTRRDELLTVWARDTLGLTQAEYHAKTQTVKNLDKPWKELGQSNGDGLDVKQAGLHHSPRTTLLMDDSPLKAILQPWNHLCIRDYTPEVRKSDVTIRQAEISEEGRRMAMEAVSRAQEAREAAIYRETASGEVGATMQVVPDRRKLKTLQKKLEKLEGDATETSAASSVTPDPPAYDETLLAVIGVLDAVKHQDNVAGWMRHGGLLKVEGWEHTDVGQAKSRLLETETSEEHERSTRRRASKSPPGSPPSPKKQRMNDESSGNDAAIAVPPGPPSSSPSVPTTTLDSTDGISSPHAAEVVPSSQLQSEEDPGSDLSVPSSPVVRPADVKAAEEASEQVETGVPMTVGVDSLREDGTHDVSLWFQHRHTLAYWCARGRKACEELGIEVTSGVRTPTEV